MATVWRADDTLLRREVAVKLPYPHLLRQPELRARFLREARAAAALDHPGILRIFDIGAEDPPFIVMELLRGRSLKSFLESSGAPLAEMVAMIGAALAAAVAVAHAAGIVHRDLKPANIMVEAGGRLVICDFGLARVDDDALATQSGELLGTPAFMSPEQALGRRVDARSDVYSLGATLYQLATGAPPYRGTAASVVQQVIKGQLEAPQRRNPTIGSELNAVILRAMAHAPAERYATAAELGAALDGVASEAGWPGDRTAELAAYFADPGAWNRQATPRILDGTLGRARSAASAGKVARALALAERVLALEPAHAEANALVSRLGVGARRRREATWLLGAVATIAAGALGFTVMHRGATAADAGSGSGADSGSGSVADAASAPDAASVPDSPPSAPDAPRRHRPRLVPDARPIPIPIPIPPPTPIPIPTPTPATLTVKILPWCDITVDSLPHGRSPGAAAISLAPGHHTLVCAQPGVGEGVTIDLDLSAGEHRVIERQLYGRVAVRVSITRGAVKVDGKPVAAGATLELGPGEHEVEIQGVGSAFVHIPTHACELRDTPELSCYESR